LRCERSSRSKRSNGRKKKHDFGIYHNIFALEPEFKGFTGTWKICLSTSEDLTYLVGKKEDGRLTGEARATRWIDDTLEECHVWPPASSLDATGGRQQSGDMRRRRDQEQFRSTTK
jgi:hypothetical protein